MRRRTAEKEIIGFLCGLAGMGFWQMHQGFLDRWRGFALICFGAAGFIYSCKRLAWPHAHTKRHIRAGHARIFGALFLGAFLFWGLAPTGDAADSGWLVRRWMVERRHPWRGGEGFQIAVEGSGRLRRDRYLIRADSLPSDAGIGDCYEGEIQRRPFRRASLRGEYDEARVWFARGLAGWCTTRNVRRVDRAHRLIWWVDRIRIGMEECLNRFPDRWSSFLKRLFLAEPGGTDPVVSGMKELGFAHLLAVSGLHVQVLFSWGMWLLSWTSCSRTAIARILLVLFFFYAAILGFPASIVRAVFVLGLRERALRRRRAERAIWRQLGALCLILLWRPYALFDTGLQLSFLCALGMECAQEHPGARRKRRAFFEALRRSLWISLWTFPVLLQSFGRISLSGLLLGWVAIPLFERFFAGSLLAVLFQWIPGVRWLTLCLFGGVYECYYLLLRGMNLFSFLTLRLVGGLSGPAMAGWYLFLAGLVFAKKSGVSGLVFIKRSGALPAPQTSFEKRRRRAVTSCLVLWGMEVLALIAVNAVSARGVTLTMLDIGQGDCLLLETPQGRWLFDTGGVRSARTGENIQGEALANELRRRGVSHLQGVFLSHRDYDHMGNLEELAGRIEIDRVYCSPDRYGAVPLSLLPGAVRGKSEAVTAGRQAFLRNESMRLFVLRAGMFDAADANNASMILLLDIGITVLLTGDLESDDRLLVGDDRIRQVDVLKVAHHGANNGSSAAFLNWSAPRVALISCGAGNAYGHPHAELRKRLSLRHIPYYRTDRAGDIVICPSEKGFAVRKKRDEEPFAYLWFLHLAAMIVFFHRRTRAEEPAPVSRRH
ncbi:MAG: ComEC/Rec2 family competence protein [Ndongobacter sp.]|nr:ComEC/Rec2 family competence protein [Ndongobacter sp.]